MSDYINRTPLASVVASVNDSLVTIATRLVGKNAVVSVTEEIPGIARQANKRAIAGLVSAAASEFLPRRGAVKEPISTVEFTAETYSVDPATGYRDAHVTRIRTFTYVVKAR